MREWNQLSVIMFVCSSQCHFTHAHSCSFFIIVVMLTVSLYTCFCIKAPLQMGCVIITSVAYQQHLIVLCVQSHLHVSIADTSLFLSMFSMFDSHLFCSSKPLFFSLLVLFLSGHVGQEEEGWQPVMARIERSAASVGGGSCHWMANLVQQARHRMGWWHH